MGAGDDDGFLDTSAIGLPVVDGGLHVQEDVDCYGDGQRLDRYDKKVAISRRRWCVYVCVCVCYSSTYRGCRSRSATTGDAVTVTEPAVVAECVLGRRNVARKRSGDGEENEQTKQE